MSPDTAECLLGGKVTPSLTHWSNPGPNPKPEAHLLGPSLSSFLTPNALALLVELLQGPLHLYCHYQYPTQAT